MVSLLPEESLACLRAVLGETLAGLNGREVQALVTADVEGSVTNQRLQQFCTDHTTDITRLLQDLVAKGFLLKDGYGRWASYRLAERLAGSRHKEEGTPDTTLEDSRHSETTPVTAGQAPDGAPEDNPALLAVAEPARKQKRLDPDEMRRLIRSLCQGRFLTFRQLATLLSREPNGLQRWTLRPMAQEKQLVMAYPETPNHPKQAYKTNPDWSAT
jgi:ATP-dependent DNA helicase RecG